MAEPPTTAPPRRKPEATVTGKDSQAALRGGRPKGLAKHDAGSRRPALQREGYIQLTQKEEDDLGHPVSSREDGSHKTESEEDARTKWEEQFRNRTKGRKAMRQEDAGRTCGSR